MTINRNASSAQSLSAAANGGDTAITDSQSRYVDRGSGTDTFLLQPGDRAALVSIPAAITGGEAPTEAEFLALRTSLIAIRQVLIDVGIMKAS